MAGMLVLAGLIAPAAAQAAPAPFGLTCSPQNGVRFCPGDVNSRVDSFDGVPLDVNVTLPATGDGPFPLVIQLHGWGGTKSGVGASKPWADRGYAVLNYTARGFGQSCGTAASRTADPTGCAKGWIHLADSRYEARDSQYLAGLLADESLIQPKKIGVTGGSYGGGQSMELAALRNRVHNIDGSYSPWKSPQGTDMAIAAAAPVVPWSDLVYSLVPNGRTLDYQVTSDTADLHPVGLGKQSFVSGLYLAGSVTGYYAPTGADADADLTKWFTRLNAGEPVEGDPVVADMLDEISQNHSAYYLDRSVAPAPLLIANGFTDDLFPVDEAVRYANLVHQRHPDVPVSQLHFDFGHMRGQSKAADTALLQQRQFEWFDRYVKGDTSQSTLKGAEALTQTCPKSAPSGGPYTAKSWLDLSPGEVRMLSAPAKTYLSAGGDPAVDSKVDPIASGNNPCNTTPAADQSGVATWRFPQAGGSGYTLLGSPTVIADLKLTGTFPHVVARLWDVAPGGSTQTLVARGLYRPLANGRQVFQLHPNGWHFAAGHTAKLELLGRDVPYARPSNGTFSVEVSKVDIRLPVAEKAGTGPVTSPAANFKPGDLFPSGAAISATKPSCVGAHAHLGSLGYRRIRLGAEFTAVASKAGLPSRMTRRRFAYCVNGGGKVVVAYTSRGRAALIVATATDHGARHLSPGDSLKRLRRVLRGERKIAGGLWRARGSRAVFWVRRGRVHAVMVAERGLLKSPHRLKAYLALAKP